MNTKTNRYMKVKCNAKEVNGFSQNRLLTKLSLMICLGFVAQIAQGACPEVKYTTEADKVNINKNILGETVYFCKMNFDSDALTYQPDEADIIKLAEANADDGVISNDRTMSLTDDLFSTTSFNLEGFATSDLTLDSTTLEAEFPNRGGYSNDEYKTLFNFYSRIKYTGIGQTGTCSSFKGQNQFTRVREFLRNNAYIFQANGGAQQGEKLNNGDDLAIIRNVPIISTTGSQFLADITFYHANNRTYPEQVFTTPAWTTQFCWVGVGAKMKIKMDNVNAANLTDSGEYIVDIGVLTQ